MNRRKKAKLTQSQTRAKVRHLAKQVRDQKQLDGILLTLENVQERRACYEYMKPFLKFNAVFPSTIILGQPDLSL